MSTGPEGEISIKGIDTSKAGNLKDLPFISSSQRDIVNSVDQPKEEDSESIGKVLKGREGHPGWGDIYLRRYDP